ncbi:hypothetical protein F1C10_14500 [Sphingomonas sp. NBWT7]|uniref:hypothetical protein n=1 Tax=Sphingomonas sp. NBWT7 TaxID=2596913 RepID=UPI00162775A4|nr:hypothetical protein [Sphingomonas sp. NBWT7]QNE33007.1 hypothetical protein F1C10_14500 [Sphingomonas sp. NBWT7]
MLKTRMKRQAAKIGRAVDRLAAIEASVAALADEDLLDLADIFAAGEPTPLREMAAAEMLHRNLSL